MAKIVQTEAGQTCMLDHPFLRPVKIRTRLVRPLPNDDEIASLREVV
jgi:hypothetical protein